MKLNMASSIRHIGYLLAKTNLHFFSNNYILYFKVFCKRKSLNCVLLQTVKQTNINQLKTFFSFLVVFLQFLNPTFFFFYKYFNFPIHTVLHSVHVCLQSCTTNHFSFLHAKTVLASIIIT